MSEIKNRYVVYEHNEKADSSYQGVRFMVVWNEPVKQKSDSLFDIIAENVDHDTAKLLISYAKKNARESFFENLPSFMQTKNNENYIKNM